MLLNVLQIFLNEDGSEIIDIDINLRECYRMGVSVLCRSCVTTYLPTVTWTRTNRRTYGDSYIFDAMDGLIGHWFHFILGIEWS
jgi:hypothetical protein